MAAGKAKKGKGVENAYLKASGSDYLRQVCNKSVKLDDFIMGFDGGGMDDLDQSKQAVSDISLHSSCFW